MSISYTITLPIPDKRLSPNARCHWRPKSLAVRLLRGTACLRTMETLSFRAGPKWPEATARVTWYAKDARRRDRDNCLSSLKAAFDGIKDAGLILDDSGLTHLPMVIAKDAKNPRVEITITSL